MQPLGRDSRPLIAYCVPVMNRTADLKATLAHNLEVLSEFRDDARLVIACFDAEPDCGSWVRRAFASELRSGLLEFRDHDPLPHWHFSWAKNAFQGVIDARYYSSLDGDNYLSGEDVDRTLGLISTDEEPVLIHHFAGDWGDGTSGRVTVPVALYRQYGYIDELLPRQFDEIGLILRTLAAHPELKYYSRPGCSIFDKSRFAREFKRDNNLTVRHCETELGQVDQPINPRGADYVQRDPRLNHYQKLNAAYSMWRSSSKEKAKEKYLRRLQAAQTDFSSDLLCQDEVTRLFHGTDRQLTLSDKLTLYTVCRDSYEYLPAWLDHYRKIGVERFIIVDDGSVTPLEACAPGADTHVVRPTFGSFRTSKVFWLEALMTAFQEPGSWVLTADIDEFVDVPRPSMAPGAELSPLAALVARVDSQQAELVPGLLIDMMPPPGASQVRPDGFVDMMRWHYLRPASESHLYHENPSVRWAFGESWPLSFAIDIRYRAFGTFDCLRKIPLFRFRPDVTLNQGFHSLGFQGQQLPSEAILAPDLPLLPVRHYKLEKLLRPRDRRRQVFAHKQEYFPRTRRNMEAIESDGRWQLRRLWESTPFARPYEGPNAPPFGGSVGETLERLRELAAGFDVSGSPSTSAGTATGGAPASPGPEPPQGTKVTGPGPSRTGQPAALSPHTPDDDERLAGMNPDRTLYFICSTQRSGSSAYCQLLHQTQCVGWPNEHFKYDVIRRLGDEHDHGGMASAANEILDSKMTPNGVTGSKLHYHQFVALAERMSIGDLGPVAAWIYIDRRDVIAQAVSMARAQQTGSFNTREEERTSPSYSFEDIDKQLRRLLKQKTGWETFFAGCGLSPLRVMYEDLLENPTAQVARTLEHLGIDKEPEPVDLGDLDIGVQRDALNDEWRERFVADFRKQYGLAAPGGVSAAADPQPN